MKNIDMKNIDIDIFNNYYIFFLFCFNNNINMK